MTKLKKTLAGLVLTGFFSLAHALPVTLSDTQEFGDQKLKQGQSFSYAHSNPFDASLYDFIGATLTLTLNGQGSNSYYVGLGGGTPLLYNGLLELASSSALGTADWGQLFGVTLSMQGTTGNPRLVSSVLTVTATLRAAGNPDVDTGGNTLPVSGPAPVNSVPEPGTIALLGLGLLGCMVVRRRPR